jgi:hypothetical protein
MDSPPTGAVYCRICKHRLVTTRDGFWIALDFTLGHGVPPCFPMDHRAITVSMAVRELVEVLKA